MTVSFWPSVKPSPTRPQPGRLTDQEFQIVKEAVSSLLVASLKKRGVSGGDYEMHRELEDAVQAGVWDFMSRVRPAWHTALGRPLDLSPPVHEWLLRGNHLEDPGSEVMESDVPEWEDLE